MVLRLEIVLRFGIDLICQIFGRVLLVENCACTCRGDDDAEHHKKDITTNTTNRRTPQTPQKGHHRKHHKQENTTNTTGPTKNPTRFELSSAASSRTRGGYAQKGRNQWFQQRPRNNELGVEGRCGNSAKASGTGEIAQKFDKGIGDR